MIYSIIVVVLSVLLASLSYLSSKNQVSRRKYFIINLSLTLLGSVLLASSHLTGLFMINKYKSDLELFGWLMDNYSLYYDLAFPNFVLIFVINVIASIACVLDKRATHKVLRTVRGISSVLSSLLLLLLPYIGYFTQNQYVNMHICMMISGVGMSLVMRAADMVALIKRK